MFEYEIKVEDVKGVCRLLEVVRTNSYEVAKRRLNVWRKTFLLSACYVFIEKAENVV